MTPQPTSRTLRQYIQIEPIGELKTQLAAAPADQSVLIGLVKRFLDSRLPDFTDEYEVVGVPTYNWCFVSDDFPDVPPRPEIAIVAVAVNAGAFGRFTAAVKGVFGPTSFGTDLAASPGEYWCPLSDQPSFGDRAAARRLIAADALAPDLTGGGVNVVVVDQGLDCRLIGHNFAGGWRHTNPETGEVQLPGMTRGEDGSHAAMIVRNVLDIAPDVKIWDFPLIPPRIWDVGLFVSDAHAAYLHVLNVIRCLAQYPQWSGHWVLVNAWAIFDKRSEHPPGCYTNRLDHPFNLAISQAADEGHDLIFCAGNCGQFCPDPRCGPRDRGPGQSILGANSHPRVISVGAVRTDARWLGYSSQGPGQPNLALRKPDLCAPSGFCETHDSYAENTGTSAACGVASGIVAALRSRWGAAVLPPDALRVILNLTAQKTDGPGWNGRLGNGVLDARAARDALESLS